MDNGKGKVTHPVSLKTHVLRQYLSIHYPIAIFVLTRYAVRNKTYGTLINILILVTRTEIPMLHNFSVIFFASISILQFGSFRKLES
jgi:hypothetical protein